MFGIARLSGYVGVNEERFSGAVESGSLRQATHQRWLKVGGRGFVIDSGGEVCLGSNEIAMHGKLIRSAAVNVAHIWTWIHMRL